MTENQKGALVNFAEEDRISDLLEEIIVEILERLPIRDAVRTSCLSSDWRYRWTWLRALVLDESFSKGFEKNEAFGRKEVITIIDQIVLRQIGPILKFDLHIPNIDIKSFQVIDNWMQILLRNDVKEVTFTNANQHRYELPSLFSCQKLIHLALDNCMFKQPVNQGGFQNLGDMYLSRVAFEANSSGTVISLPLLKIMALYKCIGLHNFNIKAKRLETLLVDACRDSILLRFMDSPCLTTVGIAFRRPMEDFVRDETMSLAKLLGRLPKIEYFFSDGCLLKFLGAQWIPNRLRHAVNSLNNLFILNFEFGDLDQLRCALCLLRSSPNLLVLTIEILPMRPQTTNDDVELASNLLEAPDCLDKPLKKLRTVDVRDLEGSRPELLFMKLLLAHSPFIEKMFLQPNRSCDDHQRRSIAIKVLQFRRASPKAEVMYLDPEP